ncbi:MaoC family dehydratase N-terminal domain-containing protein [Amycolatopsis sp. NPDC101161]|uniref:FAS1-like dehydratase domain-containing protein n=1 Tax=Amycolatopsis sp. NPDC101161 TaxID=3363940 RepID=UPI00381ED6C4
MNLRDAVAGWQPDAVETSEVIGAWPATAFAALLDQPAPTGPLPPLWHWFHFLEPTPQAALGEDGHPAEGRFLPPIPDRRRMIAGGRLEVRSPIVLGDRIDRRSALADVVVKEGRSGQMAFVTVRHEYRRGGELLLIEHQDVVYRSQPAGQRRQLAEPEPAAEPPHEWKIGTPTGPRLLFRFSALTYNTHRIHYDEPYATGVEGYPGLVVHGPLLALLLLEIPRRHGDRPVTSFAYRLSSPVFSGATVLTHGRHEGGGFALSAMAEGGATAITGTAA